MTNRTKIPWANFSINPVRGLCPMDCKDLQGKSYCYARRLYKRFGWNPEVRFEADTLLQTRRTDHKSKIFWGSTMELFGSWIKPEWLQSIFDYIRTENYGTHIFLTKQPQNLPKQWPRNCWVGITADTEKRYEDGLPYLLATDAKVKFISFEPLLEEISLKTFKGIDWVILGCRTQPTLVSAPRTIAAIKDITTWERIPLFIKEPLRTFMTDKRQEFPCKMARIGKEQGNE